MSGGGGGDGRCGGITCTGGNISLQTSQAETTCRKELWRYNRQNNTTGGRRQGCFSVETMHFSPLCTVSEEHQVFHVTYMIVNYTLNDTAVFGATFALMI